MLEQAPSFGSVARKIGEPRLEGVLKALADNVRNEIHNAKFVPLRSEVRGALKQLKADAQDFEKALNNIRKFLLALPIKGYERLPHARKVIEYCEKSLSRVSNKAGAPKKPGRTVCAMIVIEAWTFAKGRTPGANNPKLQEICDEYWRACGCQPIGEGEAGNWRRPIADALLIKGSLRSFVRNEICAARNGS